MLLSFFTEEAYDDLINNVSINARKYLSGEDWLDDFFGNRAYFKQSKTVDVFSFTPSYIESSKSDDQKSQEDLVNARNIYDAYRKLTPYQASNRLMWTYLCHAIPEYRKYTVNRWTDLRENTIKTRFFVTTQKKSLFLNSLSRLWWFAHITYDKENRGNPYALTEALLINQSICTDFLDTYNARNINRTKGVLSAIKEFKDIIGRTERLRDYFRACNKYLNRYAAVSNLDFLEADEIKKIALDYMVGLTSSSE